MIPMLPRPPYPPPPPNPPTPLCPPSYPASSPSHTTHLTNEFTNRACWRYQLDFGAQSNASGYPPPNRQQRQKHSLPSTIYQTQPPASPRQSRRHRLSPPVPPFPLPLEARRLDQKADINTVVISGNTAVVVRAGAREKRNGRVKRGGGER